MNESTVILTGVQINTPIYLGMKREYDFVHPMVDEFCRAAEFVPTPWEAPLHLVAGKGPFQRTVLGVENVKIRENSEKIKGPPEVPSGPSTTLLGP